MDVLIYLIPVALLLGLFGLAGFLWSLKSGQYDDLEGAKYRILQDDDVPERDQPRHPSRPGAGDGNGADKGGRP
ncbi:cbb3-type cytochrome oxidase assembly protein CcoS [Stappia sp. ES.058]|uniref:cbb3-type cytochrome oxidase assembly protein CcoS n=1 Tax=Stappia sp. ES.058 TaxID=1881061 RepID=UPI00087985CD|nr:cbb3-type cytochrome oxidase assembly protein CcoS [Stappia sp. ES.058]SDT94580.1 cytochrome oxidase maturation protein, cbb3-type [Stappia sp. ES.058]